MIVFKLFIKHIFLNVNIIVNLCVLFEESTTQQGSYNSLSQFEQVCLSIYNRSQTKYLNTWLTPRLTPFNYYNYRTLHLLFLYIWWTPLKEQLNKLIFQEYTNDATRNRIVIMNLLYVSLLGTDTETRGFIIPSWETFQFFSGSHQSPRE